MWIGIDVGGTKALAVALDDQLEVRARSRIATPKDGAALVSAIGSLARDVASAAGGEVAAIGVGIAGLIDRQGTVRYSPHLPDVVDLALADALTKGLGVVVTVDNDLTVAALAEARLGAARGYREVVVVALGTGIGTKVVSGGEVVLGAHGFAGEAGHSSVDRHGPRHVSGIAGAWEMYGSGSALTAAMRDAARRGEAARLVELAGVPDAIAAEHVSEAVRGGDRAVLEVLDRYCGEVAVGLGSLINVIDPDVIVLAGGVSALGEPLRARLDAQVPEWVVGRDHRPSVPIVLAELGEDAGALGAALRGADKHVGATG